MHISSIQPSSLPLPSKAIRTTRRARPALLRVAAGQDKGFMGLRSIAEVFAALTRLPVQPRIHSVEAARIVTENLLPHLEVVSLGKEDYLEPMTIMAHGGWSRAKIYDALATVLSCKLHGGAYLHLQSRGLQSVGPVGAAKENLLALIRGAELSSVTPVT